MQSVTIRFLNKDNFFLNFMKRWYWCLYICCKFLNFAKWLNFAKYLGSKVPTFMDVCLALREEVLGGQCYGGPMLWGALWLLKDPMLRRGSGCAAVTPGVALAPSIRGSQWPPLSPLMRHPILLAALAPAPPAGVCAHRCWVFGGSGFSFSLSSVKSYRLLLLRPGNKILS